MKRFPVAVLCGAGAAASLAAAQRSVEARIGANIATAVVLAVLVARGVRWHDRLYRTRVLMLLAVASVIVDGTLSLLYLAVVGHAPPDPWLADYVTLTVVPLTVAALMFVPSASPRVGHRARALSDGFLAACSLWLILLVLNVGNRSATAGSARSVILAGAVSGVFVVSVGLAVLARCSPASARMVLWMVASFGAEAAWTAWRALAPEGGSQRATYLLYQIGLILFAGAATAPAVREARSDERSSVTPWPFGVAPFLPMFACIALVARLALNGKGITPPEILPGIGIAIALGARQLTVGRDRQRLVVALLDRERSLEAALRRDELTGLANRLGLTEWLDHALARASLWPVAIALLDLDDFKLINDNHGHATGDRVLREIASRLSGAVRRGDLVARLGGDEFAVVATRVDAQQRHRLAERLISCFDAPIEVGEQRFTVATSIGIVVGQRDESGSGLLSHADAAMYRAKSARAGASTVKVLSRDDRVGVSRDLRIREEIASPDLRQIHVVYQPVVDLATGRIRGIEALARWRHPDLGPVGPDVFIPFAEQSGSIATIGDHVLASALTDLAGLQALRPRHRLAVGVNVSPRQLATPGFVDRVLALIEWNELKADQLILEITEQAFEADLEPVADAVERLAEAGVSVAVDDFGTGYSSLRYLQRLRLEIMKIDRAFVCDVMTSSASRDLVSAVAAMGTTLGLQVIAEGIETIDQLRILQGINCELGQGYLFSPPMHLADMARLIEREHVYPVGAGDAAPVSLPLPSP